jgi:hypothetical protein
MAGQQDRPTPIVITAYDSREANDDDQVENRDAKADRWMKK